jgi:penicillin V acylase-like amidase (Ntn superfamily)
MHDPDRSFQNGFAMINRLGSLMLLLLATWQTTFACTVMRFDLGGHLVIARNHDWSFSEGLLVVNKRGIQKQGISQPPATWVAEFGSVSMVQYGREIPFAGMNEQGLTVDILQLLDTKFPLADRRESVNAIQWLQYQLDTAKTVSEVVESLTTVRPAPLLESIEKVHYFVTDATGDVAIIEFLDGEAVVRQGTTPTNCALANSTWEESTAQLGRTDRLHVESSLRRYNTAVTTIEDAAELTTHEAQLNFAFGALQRVAQQQSTQWSLVYEPQERRITFTTSAAPQRRWIDLDDLQFEPDSMVQILDMNSDDEGDVVPHLQPYTKAANQRIVDYSVDRLMPASFIRTSVKLLILNYPETLQPAPLIPNLTGD